jgi:hypothetical protein
LGVWLGVVTEVNTEAVDAVAFFFWSTVNHAASIHTHTHVSIHTHTHTNTNTAVDAVAVNHTASVFYLGILSQAAA